MDESRVFGKSSPYASFATITIQLALCWQQQLYNKHLNTNSDNKLTRIAGIGPAIAQKLQQAGIEQISDFLFLLPLRYQDRTRIIPIRSLQNGTHALVQGHVVSTNIQYGKRRSLACQLKDDSGVIQLRFFHFSKAQQANMAVGTELRCFGEVSLGPRGLTMIHPEIDYEFADSIDTNETDQSLTPVYPTLAGVHQARLRKWMRQAFDLVKPEQLSNLVDAKFQQRAQLPVYSSLHETLRTLHFPPPDIDQNALLDKCHPAQRLLALEELVTQRVVQLKLKQQQRSEPALTIIFNSAANKSKEAKFRQSLPFKLTSAQERVLNEIAGDLANPQAMLRLIQGDVGSGKTIIAAICALHAANNGQQVALMAPTEILAEQHAQAFRQWLEPLDISVSFLVSKMPTAEKREQLEAIAAGQAQVVIGTHALIEDTVEFQNLSIAIIDEQHRFGVNQRRKLKCKRIDGNSVHQLVMTATPIPRTLAMTFCADHDYSVIDELPPGRKPVTTVAIDNSRREEVLERVKQSCLEGKQVYWVCTLVEESEALQCQAAETTASELAEKLPGISVGLVHGRVKADAKQRVMGAFKQNQIQLLVATTVIEVGVDVPNASLMIIENPERLGLAQLHQLRGRVGRGSTASHCVLLYQKPLSKNGRQRLNILRKTNDGFLLSEEDLKMRGPGEVFGTRQSGALALRIADLERDADLIGTAVAASDYIMSEKPERILELQRRWCPQADIFNKV